MATKTKTPTSERSGNTRKLQDRHLPFTGLLAMPFLAFAAAVLVHHLLDNDTIGIALTTGGLVAATSVLALVAHAIGAKRRPVVRWHVVTTIALTGLGEAVTVAIGLHRWWAITYLITGIIVAISWMLYRIDALRADPKEPDAAEDDLTKKLGLENTRFGRPIHHADAKGQVTRIEVPVRHGPGETAEVIQAAVAGIESVADQALGGGVPRGRSRAVPTDGAGTSNLVIITKDVLAGHLPYPGPSAPGGCITEPLVSGLHEDQQPAVKFIAGNHPLAPNPSSYGYMGMTRTGKTLNAQVNAMEMFTRRRVVVFWFDTVKGAQTVAPLRDGFDIVVASDDPRAFRAGMKALVALVKWRADALGRCGYRSWTPKAADDPQLRMPLLVAHFEEADLLTDEAPEEMVFLASKGLSTGVVSGFSLQRADATSMPTGLRFNVGNWSCFGCGDDYSAGFALSDQTIAAGAHPENWKQSKPGYFYTEGIGIDEQRWPVPAKGFGPSDEEMAAHTAAWAPRMDPLDDGSIAALGDWYVSAKKAMAADKAEAAAALTSTNTAPTTRRAASDTDRDDDMDTGTDEFGAIVATIREEVADMVADGTIEPQLDDEAEAIDPTKPIPAPPPDELSWADKDAAPSRDVALDAFRRALQEVADDAELRDPSYPDTVLFQVATLVDRYQFRSRPWFSEHLTSLVEGELTFHGLVLSRGEKAGQYRLQRVANGVPVGNSA